MPFYETSINTPNHVHKHENRHIHIDTIHSNIINTHAHYRKPTIEIRDLFGRK